jgi:hypothetical protein
VFLWETTSRRFNSLARVFPKLSPLGCGGEFLGPMKSASCVRNLRLLLSRVVFYIGLFWRKKNTRWKIKEHENKKDCILCTMWISTPFLSSCVPENFSHEKNDVENRVLRVVSLSSQQASGEKRPRPTFARSIKKSVWRKERKNHRVCWKGPVGAVRFSNEPRWDGKLNFALVSRKYPSRPKPKPTGVC